MPKSKKSRVEFSFEEELVADIVTEEVNPNFIYASPGVEKQEEEEEAAEPEQLTSFMPLLAWRRRKKPHPRGQSSSAV